MSGISAEHLRGLDDVASIPPTLRTYSIVSADSSAPCVVLAILCRRSGCAVHMFQTVVTRWSVPCYSSTLTSTDRFVNPQGAPETADFQLPKALSIR